ncbi:hypothetical protein A1O3_06905 [Capronia epimyces CBS 606.96]|uniref:Inner centromere protein ARK-binding domain-containing protein n=1 Tax=Capronia epimyces CBS 606.96 TaxID=1182542 RepID=W9XUD4_9EURO|nr:uncharacterized protein A1O3_06905 [Capronia epimyces CBS 606.96]EXJ80621.1 hypothetical protein A1O3_06905 [Capronia epimyces CBS 606.96]
MAAKATAIGSATWISAEKENALQLLQNEKEEVAFPAQHQLEWLNEHMAEIFSKRNVDVSNVFKTPGKLRGKTPRTVRKRNAQDARIPLSDVFSSQPLPRQSPQKHSNMNPPHFTIARDASQHVQHAYKSQTDSGYHGSSQGDIEVESQIQPPVPTDPLHGQDTDDTTDPEHRTTEGSFHSAKEDQINRVVNAEAAINHSAPQNVALNGDDTIRAAPSGHAQDDGHHDFDEIGSPSDESTPEKPLVRKSSLTFASLPAREPMKTSIGARMSRTSHIDQPHQAGPYSSRQALGLTQTGSNFAQHDNKDAVTNEENIEILGQDEFPGEAQTSRNHAKSSTQRLHEKIDMLGKATQSRPSQSIPPAATLATHKQPDAPDHLERPDNWDLLGHDDDDDWIKPLISPDVAASPAPKSVSAYNEEDSDDAEFDVRAPELIAHEARMKTPARTSMSPGKMRPLFSHTKAASTATLASPAKAAMAPPTSPGKSVSVSNPQVTTTPQGSPKRYLDLSASKSKLHSIMKTAKGLFTASAGVSAAAKLETLSPNAMIAAANAMPGMYPNLSAMTEDKPLPPSPPKATRRTRSSTEKEKEERRKEKDVQIMQKMDEQLEKAREKERRKIGEQRIAQEQTTNKNKQPAYPSPRRLADEPVQHEPAEYTALAAKPARPGRPAREPPINKAKPAPVSIRVGTLSQRMPANPAHSAANAQEVLPAEPKRPGLNKKTSTASLQSTTSTILKSSMHGQPPKPRALLAAERKKEQDEREAQRKLEQKREIERKRAAQQEEMRKQEQKQRADAERRERERLAAEQARRQAQQQAIERKRQEAARKAEQQRLDRAATEAARPSSRLGNQPVGRSLINHPLPTNAAKPAKRPLEEDLDTSRAQTVKYAMGPPQTDAKRRKTGDEENSVEHSFRPVVSGAPIRQSQLGKKPSIFSHNTYTQAQPAGNLGQFPQPPSRAAPPQMQQYANGAKIPFADAPNPPTHAKTPVSIMQHKTIQTIKSSPQYPNGEAIHLPEIPTDSEEEDSDDEDNAFPIPDWATPGHLTEQLIRQEEMDGDAVFGPVAPLKMEEIFAKGNKDRLKRLRDRTSSANWAISGDGLTLEEVRADREQRERMRIEGGWRFGH